MVLELIVEKQAILSRGSGMGELIMSGPLADLIRKNSIEPGDVAVLRADVFSDGIVNSREATSILALDRSCRNKCAEWDHFYVEALGDYLVFQTEPKGHVSPQNAEGIIRAISSDGIIDTRTELELLLHVMRKAASVPPSFSAFALSQVKHAVLDGEGVLARGRSLRPGVVTADDVDMLKTMLYSVGTLDSFAISRDEADVLFDINDQTAMAANDPTWATLFSKAVAASVLMVAGYTPVSADDALTRSTWRDDNELDFSAQSAWNFIGRLRGFVNDITTDTSLEAMAKARNASLAASAELAHQVDEGEAEWLAERVMRDGRLNENEKALLRLLAKEAPSVPHSLRALVDQAA